MSCIWKGSFSRYWITQESDPHPRKKRHHKTTDVQTEMVVMDEDLIILDWLVHIKK